ncbi:uncharacterized protein L199_005891 [Kwoniella botswanensis]|uniref:uncharacterized protein n=1 Tax=Kwoniella botswanensis TaxID=1268659 RepID=UPI00315CB778
MAPSQTPYAVTPAQSHLYSDQTVLSNAIAQLIDEMNEDLTRRARIYDLGILSIGIAIGLILYSLIHDLIIYTREPDSTAQITDSKDQDEKSEVQCIYRARRSRKERQEADEKV